MQTEDMRIKSKVYDRTVMYSGMCFDTTEEIHKAQEFLCILVKRGVITLPDEQQVEFNFNK